MVASQLVCTKYISRVSNERGWNVLPAMRPLVTDKLIVIKKEYYRVKLVGIRME